MEKSQNKTKSQITDESPIRPNPNIVGMTVGSNSNKPSNKVKKTVSVSTKINFTSSWVEQAVFYTFWELLAWFGVWFLASEGVSLLMLYALSFLCVSVCYRFVLDFYTLDWQQRVLNWTSFPENYARWNLAFAMAVFWPLGISVRFLTLLSRVTLEVVYDEKD